MIETLTQELADLQEQLADAREEVRELTEEIDEAWSEILDNPDIKRGDKGELRQGVREACDAAYEQGGEGTPEAADALRDHLVDLGHSANPVTTASFPPALARLVEALLG